MPQLKRRSAIKLICTGEMINNECRAYTGGMGGKQREEEHVLLTLPNIKYLVEGLEALLMTDLDGDKRAKVIKLRDDLASYVNSIFSDYS
ncbi:hypothetical protein NVIE_2094 [Nitrososphaera viennensis EN76]|uniref:Uncharacterized protein n=2 Tax=Nitrososphaera viennensis TaxID=1034015 RepID=A0A060HT25_9ARCH|nr:hypothetical protein NVIE_2094 [Nitrososphaera viennensis EN76]